MCHVLTVRVRPEHGVRRVHVAGEADLSTEHSLAPDLIRALEGVTTSVVVDVSELEFCSARGIRILAEVTANAVRRGVVLSVVGLSPVQVRMWLLGERPIPAMHPEPAIPLQARRSRAAPRGSFVRPQRRNAS